VSVSPPEIDRPVLIVVKIGGEFWDDVSVSPILTDNTPLARATVFEVQ
jgi:hypothetical protein